MVACFYRVPHKVLYFSSWIFYNSSIRVSGIGMSKLYFDREKSLLLLVKANLPIPSFEGIHSRKYTKEKNLRLEALKPIDVQIAASLATILLKP